MTSDLISKIIWDRTMQKNIVFVSLYRQLHLKSTKKNNPAAYE